MIAVAQIIPDQVGLLMDRQQGMPSLFQPGADDMGEGRTPAKRNHRGWNVPELRLQLHGHEFGAGQENEPFGKRHGRSRSEGRELSYRMGTSST